ncbi:MFS transporter [Rhodocyclus tenuis]|uniref:MFS transporter n=1 Tax=Rhodocyclus gracilis TaxID=2929842 RepID=A0ABX0WJI0_9RHOO|nr:MFS transporter [Rhodocyclus gracilis]NJA89465.1 MFS transporter [Rhodocyclus gracilis]
MTTPTAPARLGNAGLYVLLAGQLLPLIDFSIVNVALAAIAESFAASASELALLVAAYGVAFAVCLALGGRLGDRLGRRHVFRLGIALFGVSSLMCGLADSLTMLLGARTLQGVAAALIVPQVLATIHAGLTGAAHSRAIGFFGAIGGLAFVIGQVLGGYLVSADIAGSGWRSVFLINPPLCLLVLAGTTRFLPESPRTQAIHIDVPGTLLLTATVLCLLLPLALGPAAHWSWPYIALLTAVPPLLAALWIAERRQEQRGLMPLLPPALLRLPSIRFGIWLGLVFFSCWSGFMFVLALALQAGAGLEPRQSGDVFIALGAAYFVASLRSAWLVGRIGVLPTLLVGCLIQMSGLLALMTTLHGVWPHPGVLNLMPSTIIIGIGQAFIVSSFLRIGLADVAIEHAGAGSSLLSTVQQTAFGLGSALLGALFTHQLQLAGSHLDALLAGLTGELCLMLLLSAGTLLYYRRHQRLRRLTRHRRVCTE